MPAQLAGVGVVAALLLVAAWAKGALGGAAAHRRAAERFARRAGLPAAAVDGELARRVVRRHRLVLVGVGAGLATTLLLQTSWVLIYVGLALGAVTDRLVRPEWPPDAPRTAHARETRVTDYVPGWLLAAVGAAVVAAAAGAVLWLASPRQPVDRSGYALGSAAALGLIVTAAAGTAVSAALVRLLVRRPQPAASALALAVDDALRAQAVRDALHVATAAAAAAVLGFGTALAAEAVLGPVRAVGGWAPGALLVALVVVGGMHEVRGPRHWRTRLHPELDRPVVPA